MSRALSSAMQAVATAEVVKPLLFVEADFDSGDLNLWSGIGSLTYGGKTYVGAGNLLSISSIQENVELRANGAQVTLSGIGTPLLDKAKNEDYQGRELVIKLGALDATDNIIASPIIVFSGFMDTMTIVDGGDTATITVSVENRLIEFERTRVRRYTDNDQRIDYPNDDGFEYVAEIQEKNIVWGDKDANPISYGKSVPARGTMPRFP